MEGNGAWSSTATTELVPVPRAFANLRAALDLAPSLVEVEQALNSMELHLRRAAIELGSDAPSSPVARATPSTPLAAEAAAVPGVEAFFTTPVAPVLLAPATTAAHLRLDGR